MCKLCRYGCALLVAGAGLVAIKPGAADEVVLNPARDATLYEDGTGSVANGAGDYFFVGATTGGALRRGLIYFDVASSVPAGATITAVTFEAAMSRTISGANNVTLHRVQQNWGEGTSNATGEEGQGANATTNDATWIHTFFNTAQWSTAGGDFDASARAATSVNGLGTYQWSGDNLIADVQAWLDSPSTNFGWLVKGNEADESTAQRFNAREFATASQRPKLSITYTPGNPAEKWVDFGFSGSENGTQSNPYNTLAEAVAAVSPGGTVFINAGSSAETLSISKAMTLEAVGGTVRVGQAARATAAASVSTSIPLQIAQDGPAATTRAVAIPAHSRRRATVQPVDDTRSVFPDATENGIALAGSEDTLWIRLIAAQPIRPESILVELTGAENTSYDALWEPDHGNDLRDLWVGAKPLEAWESGGSISLGVKATTVTGEAIGPLTYTWNVEK